jgi:predicted amidohydrolase YtcJ
MIVLSKNLFDIPPAQINQAKVLATYFEGKEIYRAEK